MSDKRRIYLEVSGHYDGDTVSILCSVDEDYTNFKVDFDTKLDDIEIRFNFYENITKGKFVEIRPTDEAADKIIEAMISGVREQYVKDGHKYKGNNEKLHSALGAIQNKRDTIRLANNPPNLSGYFNLADELEVDTFMRGIEDVTEWLNTMIIEANKWNEDWFVLSFATDATKDWSVEPLPEPVKTNEVDLSCD